ncbi:arsenate reductase family protein [Maribacter sp. 2307ULW6-5]|uniref:arsenate reductase family protein n=1 Tax=Maribacter sp. 2307ULW6-5 TaxID=3386275 RepID=UPI0039BD66F0
MSILATSKHQMTFIYSSDSHLGQQILGYLQGSKKKTIALNINKSPLADTVWTSLAEDLQVPLGALFAASHPDVPDFGDTSKFSTEDWLKLINEHPELLQRPIVVHNGKTAQLANRSQILRFFGVDSAGLKKTMSHEEPTTQATTDNEKFIR